jgi:hypothetical protein
MGPAHVRPSTVVALAALAAVVLRYPGLLEPIDADEAGFTLVARAWDPLAGTLFGDYWVARPPVLMALVGISDAVGGPLFLRVVGAAASAVVVIASAATAREALRYAGVTDPAVQRRTAAWTAVLAAAFLSNTLIDPVSAKGELLGIPFVVMAFWLALRALNRGRVDRAAVVQTVLAGAAASLALGMKQSLAGGLVFGLALLVGSRLRGRLTNGGLARLAVAGVIGAALPVAAVVGWAVATGVRLDWLWFTVYGFRSDALEVLATESTGGSGERGLALVGIACATGMALVVAGVVHHRQRVWRLDPVLLGAVAAVLVVDTTALILGGHFWPPYLFGLVPALVLCAALLLAGGGRMALRARVLVAAAALCTIGSSVVWAVLYAGGSFDDSDVASGGAIAEAARPGDTIVSYGGAADLVLTSGLRSPYPYLWSLQMRTRDPDLADLRRLLAGPQAPTWVVMLAPSTAWGGLGDAIRPVLEERYVVHGEVCHGRSVWLLAGVERPPLTLECPGT